MSFLKDYEPVEDRLRAFWKDHPNGRIETELVHHDDGVYIVKASAFKVHFLPSEGGLNSHPDATGYARDATAELPANMKASALEVCETSAIGRALANLGYAAKGKRPSREEMSKTSGSGKAAPSAADSRRERQDRPGSSSGEGTASEPERATAPPSPDHSVAVTGEGTRREGSEGGESGGTPPSESCDHRWENGKPSKVLFHNAEYCGRCWQSWVVAMEGTTADLGQA